MTTGSVSFYKMRGSLSSGEYPLLTSGQNLSQYHLNTQTVKYAKGLQTRVTVPQFTGWESANVAQMDDDFYWVTESRESTTYNGSAEFLLDYMGPTSFFRSGASVKGAWHKTASNECPYLKQEITNGPMDYSSFTEPQDLDMPVLLSSSVAAYYGFWVQVTGFTSSQRTTINRVAFPIMWDDSRNNFVTLRAPADNSGHDFPSWYDMLSDITAITGIQADQIIDCSISKRCPHPFTVTDSSTPARKILSILDSDGVAIQPQVTSSGYYVFFLNSSMNFPKTTDNTETITIDTSSAYIRQCAELSILDWNKNRIMSIPILGPSTEISFTCHADMSGISTIITCNNQQISVPEGKLPYIEDSWETYKAYQMEGDRQAMHNAIQYARFTKETADISGIANTTIGAASTGVMTGAIAGNAAGAIAGAVSGVAGAAVALWENQRAYELSEMRARNDYELSKKRAIDAPQTSYNTPYGLIYCYLNRKNALCAAISSPHDTDSAYYSAWCAEYGYPCEGVKTVTITNGYYQGKLLSTDVDRTGMYWDECNKTFMQGFKFINP